MGLLPIIVGVGVVGAGYYLVTKSRGSAVEKKRAFKREVSRAGSAWVRLKTQEAAGLSVPADGSEVDLKKWIDRVQAEFMAAVASAPPCVKTRDMQMAWRVQELNDSRLNTVWGQLIGWRKELTAAGKPIVKPQNAWRELQAVREMIRAGSVHAYCMGLDKTGTKTVRFNGLAGAARPMIALRGVGVCPYC